MSNYAYRKTPPTTLTRAEQRLILRVTGERSSGFRDHVLISLALGAGLREHELAALNVGDVVRVAAGAGAEQIRDRVGLRVFKGHRRAQKPQVVRIGRELRRKLALYVRQLETPAGLELTAPLFLTREGTRIATRTIRHLWRAWQLRAGFARLYPFHCARHTYVSNAYRASGDVVAANRLARHVRLDTTMSYIHPSDDELDRLANVLGR